MKKKQKIFVSFLKNPRQLVSKKHIYEYLLILILLVSIFFRFYNTPARYGFDFDPTRDALVSQYGAENLKFPLIGPKSGIAPFTFGPWYYYQIIGARLLIPVDYAPWIYIGITSVLTVLVMYFIGKKLEDKKLGLILALLMALSPAELGPITGLSNPNLIPIQASLSLLLFIYYFKQKLAWYFAFIWGVVIGIGINNHYQMVGLLILPFLAVVFRKISIKECLLIASGLVITFLPLLYYNVTHDWQTIHGYIYFQRVGKYAVYTPNRWLFYVRDFWPNFWSYVIGVPLFVGLGMLGYTIGIGGYALWKRNINWIYLVIFATFAINFIFLRYFAGPRENYYFIYLHPFLILFFGWTLWFALKQKYLKFTAFVALGIVLVFVLKEDIRRLNSEERYLTYSRQVEDLIKEYPNTTFQIFHCGKNDKNRTQAISYFLYRNHKLQDNGIKIGIKGEDCLKLPITAIYSPLFDGYIFLNTEQLNEADWRGITPKNVYEESVEWYK